MSLPCLTAAGSPDRRNRSFVKIVAFVRNALKVYWEFVHCSLMKKDRFNNEVFLRYPAIAPAVPLRKWPKSFA